MASGRGRKYEFCVDLHFEEREIVKIAIGSVVKGFALKSVVKKHLESQGHEVIDLGCPDTRVFAKYSSVGERVARALQTGQAELAVNICGSGTGAALAAGKFRGVCAVSCETVETARLARVINDANCLCMGESIVAPDRACKMVDAFIAARFRDVEGVPGKILDFWREARDEFMTRGPEARDRPVETIRDV